jgi:hypothetical protein
MSVAIPRLGFLDTIDIPVGVVRTQFRRLFMPVFIAQLLLVPPNVVVQVANLQSAVAPSAILLVLLMYPPLILGSILAYLTAFVAARHGLDDEPLTTLGCFREALTARWWGGLIVVGLAVLAGSCACILPGIALAVLLALVPAVMVHEGAGLGALGRSIELVAHHSGHGGYARAGLMHTLGVLLVVYLVQAAITSLPSIAPAAVGVVEGLRQAASGQVGPVGASTFTIVLLVVSVLLTAPFAALAALYAATTISLLFRQLRERREAPELGAALAARTAAATEP